MTDVEYRRELERIRARFEESAAEAERRNDAQAFLEAMHQRDREIQDAKRNRNEADTPEKRRAILPEAEAAKLEKLTNNG